MEAGDRLLPGVAALGVRDPADLVVPDFLRQGLLLDLDAKPGPPRQDAGRFEETRRLSADQRTVTQSLNSEAAVYMTTLPATDVDIVMECTGIFTARPLTAISMTSSFLR